MITKEELEKEISNQFDEITSSKLRDKLIRVLESKGMMPTDYLFETLYRNQSNTTEAIDNHEFIALLSIRNDLDEWFVYKFIISEGKVNLYVV